MGDTLFGGEKSGTPIETRGGSQELARMYSGLMRGQNPFQRMGAQSFANLFGVTPGEAGVPSAVTQLLTDPNNRTEGLFKSMRPFERRQTNDAVAGTRNIFGTMGGRFSRGVADAEARVRGEHAAQFGRNREQALLTAEGQRANFLAQLLGIAGQTQANELNAMTRFLQPGAPVHTEGLVPGLIGSAANLFGMYQMFKGGGNQIPSMPGELPAPSDPFGPGGPYSGPNPGGAGWGW